MLIFVVHGLFDLLSFPLPSVINSRLSSSVNVVRLMIIVLSSVLDVSILFKTFSFEILSVQIFSTFCHEYKSSEVESIRKIRLAHLCLQFGASPVSQKKFKSDDCRVTSIWLHKIMPQLLSNCWASKESSFRFSNCDWHMLPSSGSVGQHSHQV